LTALAGPDYRDWLRWMHALDIYPAWDNTAGEIVYVNRSEYEKEVCGNPDPTRPNCTSNPQFNEFISQVEVRNFAFLQYLGDYIRRQCYIPADAMRPYFPDLTNIQLDSGQRVNFFDRLFFPSLTFLHDPWPDLTSCPTTKKLSQDSTQGQQELGRLITQAAADYTFSQEDPFGDFFHSTSVATLGFLPANTILELVALKSSNAAGYQYNNQVVLDSVFAVATILPPAKVGRTVQQISRIGSKALAASTVFEQGSLYGQRAETIRKAILEGERISRGVIEEEIAKSVHTVELPPIRSTLPWPEYLRPNNPYARSTYETYLESHIRAGEAYLVNRADEANILRVKNNVLNWVNGFIARTQRNIALNPSFREILDNRRIFIVDDNIFNEILLGTGHTPYDIATIPAFVRGDMMIVKDSIYPLFLQSGSFEHEVWHLIGTPKEFFGLEYRSYLGDSKIYHTLISIFELMTDYGGDISRGVVPFSSIGNSLGYYGYAYSRPTIAKGIYDRLLARHPELLDDFIEFSLTRDGPKLITAVSQKTGRPATESEFLRWFEEDGRVSIDELRQRFRGGSLAVTGGVLGSDILIPQRPFIDAGTNVFLDENSRIEIIGNACQGNNCTVSFVVQSGGVSEDPNQFDVTFALDPLSAQNSLIKTALAFNRPATISQMQALAAQRISPDSYLVTLNNSTDANLEACISKKGTIDIISCSSPQRISGISSVSTQPSSQPTPPESPTVPSKQVSTIRFNNVLVYDRNDPTLNNLDNPIDVHLPALTEGIPNPSAVFVDVIYSEEGQADTSRRIILPFYYLNYTPTPAETPNPEATPLPSIEGAVPILPSSRPRSSGLPAPRGLYILRGNPCGSQSGSNATLTCEPGSACSSPTYGTCIYNYSAATPYPVGVIATPTPRPLTAPQTCRSGLSCSNDNDCGGCGLRCLITSGGTKSCR